MGHGQLHPRGDNEPDVELHLVVVKVNKLRVKGGKAKYIQQLVVRELAEGTGDAARPRQGVLDEPWVDYRDEIKVGEPNVFYVPVGLAQEAGLV